MINIIKNIIKKIIKNMKKQFVYSLNIVFSAIILIFAFGCSKIDNQDNLDEYDLTFQNSISQDPGSQEIVSQDFVQIEMNQDELSQNDFNQNELNQSKLNQNELNQSELNQNELNQSELSENELSQDESNSSCKLNLSELVIENPQNFSSKALIYCPQSPFLYNKIVDCNISFGEINVETDGNISSYTIPVTISLYQLFTKDNYNFTACISPQIEFSDANTLEIFPSPDISKDGEYAKDIIINNGQTQNEISYSCSLETTIAEYEKTESSDYRRLVTFNAVYKLTCPSDYEDLLMVISPVTEYKNPDNEIDSNIRQLTADYVKDSKIFRINKEMQ